MPAAELIAHVQTVFEEQERRNGQTNHRDVAVALLGQHSSLVPNLSREVLRMPTRQHLYDGAEDTLRELLKQNGKQDRIIIWTQGNPTGQLWKVGMSGLGALRKEHGRERFGIHAAEDKIATLPKLLNELNEHGSTRVVIVDDKAKNIAKVAHVAESWRQNHPTANVEVVPVWINQGRTKDQVPEGTTLEEFKATHHTVEDIRELQAMQATGKRTAWLIDWDHTLNETARAKEQLFSNMATTIERHHPDTVLGSHILDLQARIAGAHEVIELQQGMSGRRVFEARHREGAVVVKHAPGSEKTRAEIRGIQHLLQMPHRQHMPGIHLASERNGIIAMESIPGNSGREKLKYGMVTEQDMQHVDGIIDMKLQWLTAVRTGNSPVPDGMRVRSMQREEFDDTLIGIQGAVEQLSTAFQLLPQNVFTLPTVYDGTPHLSLEDTVQTVANFYEQSAHDDKYPLHGDVSWSNMIFTPDKAYVIDGEWTGLHDPAEAYARTAKVISTTTTQEHITANLLVGVHAGQEILAIETNDPFQRPMHHLQRHLLDRGGEFSVALQDPTFMRKLYMYLAGSYLRELAIANRRGMGPNEQLFALKKAIDMVELAQTV